jgi:hypothetical protein
MAEFLTKTNPRLVAPPAYRAMLVGFLETDLAQVERLLLEQKGPKDTYSFTVSAVALVHHDPSLAYNVLYHPKVTIHDTIYATIYV